VDDGSTQAENLLPALRQAGFTSVRQLDGGIAAWQAIGAATVGPDRNLPPLLSPTVVLNGVASGKMGIIDARKSGKPLPFAGTPSVIKWDQMPAEEIRRSVSANQQLIILTDNGADRENFRVLVEQASGVPLFFVQGGAAALNNEYMRMAQAASKPEVARLDGTATVSNKRISRSRGGCSSCP